MRVDERLEKGIKHLLLFAVVALIFIGMVAATSHLTLKPAKAQTQTWIAVNLPKKVFEFKDFFEPMDVSDPYKGDRVTVRVDINVTDLYGFEYKLRWNNTLLNVTRYTILSPWGEGNYSVSADETSDLGDGYGQHYLGVEANETAGVPVFNGTTTICRYTFDLKRYPFYPLSTAICNFTFTEHLLLDILGQPIDHDPIDGSCTFKQQVVPLVEVDDINWTLPVGSNCTVYVRISNVTKSEIQAYCERFFGVRGMVLELYFDTEYLDALSIEPNRTSPKSPADHFFEPSNPDRLFFGEVSIIDDYFDNGTYGRVRVGFAILEPEEPKLGGGVLARINFNITASGTGRPLRLYAPGHPFPLHLSYENDKLHRAGVVPCTLAEVQALEEEEDGDGGIPMGYIIVVVLILVIIGSVVLYFLRRKPE
jgi:hypothetical protein